MDDPAAIFVSYSSSDAEIASELVSRLHDVGLRCFVAERDITAAQQWEPTLRDEIKKSKAVLILLTPRSIKSGWVAIETGAAWVLEKTIIPVTMFVEPGELSEPIRKYQIRPVETNAQTTNLIQEIQNLLQPKGVSSEQIASISATEKREDFSDIGNWTRLQKIGRWDTDELSGVLSGEGQNHYLLSHAIYGNLPFRIEARIRFLPLRSGDSWSKANAGIVFGWKSTGDVRRYYHLMFSGTQLLLELIGERGGTVYQDFQHLDDGIPYQLRQGDWINVDVSVGDLKLVAQIDGQTVYSASLPSKPVGRVGLRPWRTRMESDRFTIST